MLSVETIDLPVPESASPGYGSATRSLGDGSFVTSWIEGSASFRLARVHARTGNVAVIKGVRGLLRDVITDPAHERAWLLCTHALHEVALSPLKITRTLVKGLGDYNYSLTAFDGGVAAVSKRFGRASVVVSLEKMRPAGRLTVPAPQAAILTNAGLLLLSFHDQSGRLVRPDMKVDKTVYRLPLGTTPVVINDMIVFLPGTRRPPQITPEIPQGFDVDRYSTVIADGSIALYDTRSGETAVIATHTAVRSLHGADSDGRLVASDRTEDLRGVTFMLAASTDGRILDSAMLSSPILDAALIEERVAVVAHHAGASVARAVTRLSWT
jgi:hypothetical protein